MPRPQSILLFGVEYESIVDGPGCRTTIFLQGCSHKCQGCHNPDAWEFDESTRVSHDEIMQMLDKHSIFTKSITWSGGDPLYQADSLLELSSRAYRCGYTDQMLYTGYKFPSSFIDTQDPELDYQLIELNPMKYPEDKSISLNTCHIVINHIPANDTHDVITRLRALQYIKLLCSEPFLIDHLNPSIRFRGSDNQRIWLIRVDDLNIHPCHSVTVKAIDVSALIDLGIYNFSNLEHYLL